MATATRTARVYEMLKQELLDSVHAPSSKLAIDHLAERFKASPGAVREALARLTSDRLVVALPQRGFVVAPTTAEDLKDLTEVRIEIETRCLQRSIELGTLEWEGRLLSAWHQLSRTRPADGDDRPNPDWSRLHAQFHDELIAACDSRWWLHLRDQLYTQAERYRRMILPYARVERDIDAEHGAILEHAIGRDVDAACAALRSHLQLTSRILLDHGLPDAADQAGQADGATKT